MRRLLVADRCRMWRNSIGNLFHRYDFQIRVEEFADLALANSQQHPPDVLITECQLTGGIDGPTLAAELYALNAQLQCILMFDNPNELPPTTGVTKAWPSIQKPFHLGDLLDLVIPHDSIVPRPSGVPWRPLTRHNMPRG